MEDLETVKAEALQIMGVFQVLPRLVVFDLDYTLWPFYCECRSKRDTPYLYPHARGILRALKREEIDVAIASKSPTPDIATTYLDKLSISSMFVAKEIFYSWTNKTDHFQRIHSRTGVPFNSMLFFDDDNNNIQGVSKMGVTSILVRNGVNLGEFKEGLANFLKSGMHHRTCRKGVTSCLKQIHSRWVESEYPNEISLGALFRITSVDNIKYVPLLLPIPRGK